ncbi:MAG TPA: TIGR00730 family Rossman fold protein [Terracidiphilus sp.]|nr:TIGR00730 family Rossman fold protein [Terracidiphilus sp.]
MSRSNNLRRVAVYCGSTPGNHPAYRAEAVGLGSGLAAAGLGVVYGGANAGLMGAMADAALAGGAEVIGILPHILVGREIAHTGLTRLETVKTMHQRKARMVKLADAFFILPGGYGTLDEMLEIITWSQLRLHAKPCILINTLGYWNRLLDFLDSTVEAGFLKPENRALILVAASAQAAIDLLIARER